LRKWSVGLLGLALAAGTGVVLVTNTADASPVAAGAPVGEAPPKSDESTHPLEEKRRAARQTALNLVLNGQARAEKRGASTVVKVGAKATAPAGGMGIRAQRARADQYVELSREKTDKIFVVLVEFGNKRHPNYPDQDTKPETAGPTTFDGPVHNQIPKPERAKDNKTIWQADYSRQHYQDLYFGAKAGTESVKTYYERQSSGRYSVDGTVTDWVKVPYNEARYGRDNVSPCADPICNNISYLIRDGLESWVVSERAKGRTDAQIGKDLQSFDQWDRYDYDGDGDFNEPDGYLDHFQIVHAGGDEADGDKIQGEDAIWSHRSYNFPETKGREGPAFNKLGGSPVGSTGLWVGDYTVQPENGGISVFAHEYGHDLGLPDHYDTSGASGNAENPVNWWTLMGQSRVSAPGDQGLGTRAADLSAWDKLQLGWLDYEVVKAGQDKTVDLGPHEYNSAKAQGAVVVLPKKTVTTPLPKPTEGTKSWWSGSGDGLNNTLARKLTLPSQPATMSFQASWDIEDCGADPCDYAFVEVNDGSGFTAIPGSITRPGEGNGIDGASDGWTPATFDLAAYAGKQIDLRIRYSTDSAAGGKGIFVDALTVKAGDTVVVADGAESGPNGWASVGFSAVGDSMTTEYDNYYIATNRTYESYDKYLKTGPYNFGFNPGRPDWTERFPYQQGLLISYWDTSQRDNNTSKHPGEGEVLPIDAHPELLYRLDGQPWRPRIQGYDAPFSLNKADSFTLHADGKSSYIRGQAPVAGFDDSRQYYVEDTAAGVRYGVKVPKHGIKIKVQKQDGTSMRIRVSGGPK
jgi:immune inhibitor A